MRTPRVNRCDTVETISTVYDVRATVTFNHVQRTEAFGLTVDR